MHGVHGIKIITAKQAREINNYQKTKQKLLKAKAAIWFNKECRNKQLQPKYIQIKIKGNNKQNQNTKTAAIKFRLNQEIKCIWLELSIIEQKCTEFMALKCFPIVLLQYTFVVFFNYYHQHFNFTLSTHEAINAAFDRALANASCVPGLSLRETSSRALVGTLSEIARLHMYAALPFLVLH